jgi:dTMP kinase
MPTLVVCIDGTDFSGKTTISNLLLELLREKNKNRDIIIKKTVLPSDLITGSFTKILRNSADIISSKVFALAYALDHLHHYETVIKPLEEEGKNFVVIQERSLLTTYIYQGIVGDVDFNWLKEINKFDKNIPDLTLILKVELDELLKRKSLENKVFDKFEVKEHLERQIEAYSNIPEDLAKQFHVEYIDANEDPIDVASKCADRVQKEIDKKFK